MRGIDSFEHQLRVLARDLRKEVISELDAATDRTCELCGIQEVKIDSLPPDARVEFYTVPCIEPDCDGTLKLMRYVIATPEEIPAPKTDIPSWRCSSERCDADVVHPLDAIDGYEPHHTEHYHIPVTYLVKSPLHLHHTSYHPEETILVCSDCHGRIHADNDLYHDLEPEMSRKEAEEIGPFEGESA